VNYGFHPAAEAEHLEQIAFYELRQQGLGAKSRDRFLQMMTDVCATAARFSIEYPPDIRRARLQPFPLKIVFPEYDARIQVLAVAHYRTQ
jgi:hypothetical protein